jgi:hypothetical protein
MFTNVYPHKTLENVVVHFFIARRTRWARRSSPTCRGTWCSRPPSTWTSSPGARRGGGTPSGSTTPGAYLIRVESRQTGSDHEHFAAIDLVIEGTAP